MLLKRLDLQGYKTFAAKTELVFDAGLTAIVGPNGSGKSNIADALRWVLGEQSFGEMRVKRGEDLIFAGSQQRARAGMASASLTLDNSDGWLPIDFSEVEIGRKTYRSGDTEYTLNGQKVRLRDVAELLASSGLSERNYTIIGQGMIDRALSLNADERRALFEEAAGISHYKARRSETLRRLQETHHNLERIHDILSEIRPRLSSLKRQADRAQNYDQIAADLRLLLRQWYGFHWAAARRQMRLSRQAAHSAESAWRESRAALQRRQAELEQVRRQSEAAVAEMQSYEGERQSLQEGLEQARRQVAVLRERQAQITQQVAELAQEWPDIQAQQRAVADQLAAAEAEWEAAQAALAQAQADLSAFDASFQGQQAAIERAQGQVRALETAQREAQTRLAGWQGQLSQLEERAQDVARAQSDPTTGANLQTGLGRFSAESDALQAQLSEHRLTRTQTQAQIQTHMRDLKQARRTLSEAGDHLNRLGKELARLEARRDMFDQLRRKNTPAPPAAAVVGRLTQQLTIPPAHQTAVEAALQSRLHTILVADEEALWQLAAHSPEQPWHVVARQPQRPRPTRPAIDLPGVLGWADELLTYPPDDAGWLAWLLGAILLVDSAATAYAAARRLPLGLMAVAPDGCVVQAGGLMTIGGRNSADAGLANEQQWRAAESAVTAQQAQVETARATVQALEEQVRDQQSQVDQLNEQERQALLKEQQLTRQRADIVRQMEQTRQQLAQWQRQQTQQAEESERLRARRREIAEAITRQSAALPDLEAQLEAARQALTALPTAEINQRRLNLQQTLATSRSLAQSRQAVVDGWRVSARQAHERAQRLEQRQVRLAAQEQAIDLPTAQAQMAGWQSQLAALEEALQPLRARQAASHTRRLALEEAFAVAQAAAHDLETAYTQARVDLSHQESQLEHLRERIHTDLGLVDLGFEEDETAQTMLPLSDVVERLPVVESLPDDLDESIQRRRRQLQRMGPINPSAPEEYQATQTRYDFLSQQSEDLTHTEAQLRRVIRELDEMTSRAFAETVEKVDAVFGEVFKRLFGGGSAQLVLTDPENLTVSGVDIVARLPGKRAQGLGLLSGGERSLTAAALIFSLLKVSPTPFCVLDEVDAMLDEANVNRFTDMLRELSMHTQFIVITHNRGTVQAANTLYGISMGADGVSQIISIKPEDYLARL